MDDRKKKGFRSDDEANIATGSADPNERGGFKSDDEANTDGGSSVHVEGSDEVEEETTERTTRRTEKREGVDDKKDRTDGD